MSKRNRRIVFRADGSFEMGLGHVYRSLALAKMLESHFELLFLSNNSIPELKEKILETCDDYVGLSNTDDISEVLDIIEDNDIVVLDGYHFNGKYQKKIKRNCYKVISIDDLHADHFYSDFVINQCDVSPDLYITESYTKLLLGEKYALLRPEFLDAARKKNNRKINQSNTLFICMGGSDYYNITTEIIRAVLGQDKFQKVNVVLGAANAHKKEIQELAGNSDHIQIFQNLSASDMCSLMLDSDVAIAPGSSLSFEVCAVGMSFISGYYTDNQLDIVNWLEKTGCALILGDFRKTGPEGIKSYFKWSTDPTVAMSMLNSQKIIDGYSNERLKRFFLQL